MMFRAVTSACKANSLKRFAPSHIDINTPVQRSKQCFIHNNGNNMSSSKSLVPTAEPVIVEDNFIKKFFKTVGWIDHTKTRLKLSGYFLYECIPDTITYTDWFEELDIPDVFSSWFTVTELYVWMLMVRTMSEDLNPTGKGERYIKEGDGRFVRNCIVEALWADVANRIKLLGGISSSVAKTEISVLSEQFQAALISYDEGLDDDRILAAAIWRRIFNMELVDAQHVERVVKLVRKQIYELDRIPWQTLIKQEKIAWLSIKDMSI